MRRIVPKVCEITPGIVGAVCGDLTVHLIRVMQAHMTQPRIWTGKRKLGYL